MTTHADESTAGEAAIALKQPLQRFRVAAFVTGVGLLGLVVVMVIRYGFGNAAPSAVYSPIHGVIYMIYMALTIDLALKARWSMVGTALVLLAGCVPFVSFIAERGITRRVHAGRNI